jgi:hypothetical protein
MAARSGEPTESSLVVIARNASGQIVTRISSHRDLVGAMHTGCCVLTLKLDAVRVEVHYGEGPTSEYRGKPLAAMCLDDLAVEQTR